MKIFLEDIFLNFTSDVEIQVQDHCTSFIQQVLYGCNTRQNRSIEEKGPGKDILHRLVMTLTIYKGHYKPFTYR